MCAENSFKRYISISLCHERFDYPGVGIHPLMRVIRPVIRCSKDITVVAIFSIFIAIPAWASEATETQDPQSTYLLAKIKKNEEYLIKYIRFRRVGSEGDVVLKGQFYGRLIEGKTLLRDELILMKAAPGEYYLEEIKSFYDNLDSGKFGQPNQLIRILPGRINYIGDIKTSVDDDRRRSLAVKYEYLYTNETVLEAESRNRKIFSFLESVVCPPGEEPIVLDVPGIKDTAQD